MPKLLAKINLPQYPSAPSGTAAQGDMYYNTTDDKVYVYDGSNWLDMTGAGSGSGDITAVVAGTGLTGGATSGSATLDVDTTYVATKSYVDEVAAGMNWHAGVHVATAAALPNSPTYTAGTADASNGYGIGAKLESGANARLVVDGTEVSTGQRVLVKNQSNAVHNGIYDVTQQGSVSAHWILTRATDADNNIDGQLATGDAVYVYPEIGSINRSQGFILSSLGSYSGGVWLTHQIGTDDIIWSQFTGLATITTGSGLAKTNNTIDVDYGDGLKLDVDDKIAVDLENTVTSTSTTKAATAASVKSAYDLASSADTTASAAIPKSVLGAKGAIVVATASLTPVGLSVGTNNQILIANSAETAGVQWITSPYATATDPVISGKVVVDNNAGAPQGLDAYATETVFHGLAADTHDTNLVLDSHGTGVHPQLVARSTRGTSASPTATQSGDVIGEMVFHGYGSTDYAAGKSGTVRAVATQNFTDSVNGSKIEVGVVANGSSAVTVGLTVTDTSVNIPTSSEYQINSTTVLSATALGATVISSSLTSIGTVSTGTWQATPVGILYGGTGQTTASAAINALLPSQASNSGKLLTTDGTDVSWYTLDISNQTIDGGSA